MQNPLQQVLDETRQRFVAAFPAECDTLRVLVERVAELGPEGPVAPLAYAVHRLTGLAGTIGFPAISARAGELERLIFESARGAFDAPAARDAVAAMAAAFVTELAAPPPWTPSVPVNAVAPGGKILVAEDEADQLAIVISCLAGAGYVPVAVRSGDLVVDAARSNRPELICSTSPCLDSTASRSAGC